MFSACCIARINHTTVNVLLHLHGTTGVDNVLHHTSHDWFTVNIYFFEFLLSQYLLIITPKLGSVCWASHF